MEAVQSGDEEVQHTSELDVVKAGLATASVDLKKTMSLMIEACMVCGTGQPRPLLSLYSSPWLPHSTHGRN